MFKTRKDETQKIKQQFSGPDAPHEQSFAFKRINKSLSRKQEIILAGQ
jgi:hypothetical protein